MKSMVTVEMTTKEYDIVRKAIFNYKGKLDYQLSNKDMDLEFTKKVADELKTANQMIRNMDDEHEDERPKKGNYKNRKY